MIFKLILVIGIIAAIYFVFFKKKPRVSKDTKEELKGSDMIECASCGIYSQLDDSILSNGKYYCSKECLEKVS
ncbi:MAG: PP0621 family protein [Sulfurimonas sp.]|nr:PP0621 family protein [Sulfurimonas sp.]